MRLGRTWKLNGIEIEPSSCGGPGSKSSAVPLRLGGDLGLRLPSLSNDVNLSFPLDCGLLFDSPCVDVTPEATDDASDMVDWFGSGDVCDVYMLCLGDNGEFGGRERASGDSEAMDLFLR